MKKLSILLFSIILFTSCAGPTKREKMMESISGYLKKTLDDPNSYESSSFGVPYKISTRAEGMAEYMALETELNKYIEDSAFCQKMLTAYSAKKDAIEIKLYDEFDLRYKTNLPKIDSVRQLLNTFVANNPTKFVGYYIDHDFRANNKLGAKVLEKGHFILDSTYAVLNVYEEQPILTYNYELMDLEEK